ncbi:hypothetical protein I4I73_21345 [Pseudonocardia sp. KRD-184]|uniref:Uncharacterized protein n=1 Tax=Pseudonocardia oceani TaxID=2792013 RepID=A0ABS6UFY5_9PSEU|nr:hypothetical protein [Pseudonocardia oceani]MBW0090510.1 hypothetical protein [Pseudonocardia oceani]MBW0098537.1 hypothetical protein [Pseudonocardia oceani]MBW0124377.1 hypothetical protein [Pseudonocardia oceani]MBW0131147.1 hypothetical protein [Pseudonocardia oceani]MBW0132591.1 hypothetical protein [Pseudonocardia oceani]
MGLFSSKSDRDVPRRALDPQPDVKVKHTAGCELDGRTDQHTHPQAEWRAHIDKQDPWGGR